MADNVEGAANLAKVLLQFVNSGKLVEAASALEKAASSKQLAEETKVQPCKQGRSQNPGINNSRYSNRAVRSR